MDKNEQDFYQKQFGWQIQYNKKRSLIARIKEMLQKRKVKSWNVSK